MAFRLNEVPAWMMRHPVIGRNDDHVVARPLTPRSKFRAAMASPQIRTIETTYAGRATART
jgi:hypothetical protein